MDVRLTSVPLRSLHPQIECLSGQQRFLLRSLPPRIVHDQVIGLARPVAFPISRGEQLASDVHIQQFLTLQRTNLFLDMDMAILHQ